MIESIEKAAECENKQSNNKSFFWGEGGGGAAALVQVFSKFLMHQL